MEQATVSIAVLPFVNMTSDPENEYFSDGITEEIINALAKIEGLMVTARTSSFAFKGMNQDIRQIGEKLNVRTILEGSVRQAGERVRVTAQLIKVEDGYHIWSETYDQELKDIFEVQDLISRCIAEKLREHLGHFYIQDRLVERSTQNMEAYNLFLKGKYHSNKWNLEDGQRGIRYFEAAIDLEPKYAPPYACLAGTYSMMGAIGFMSPLEAFPKAQEYAQRAMELTDQIPEVYQALGGISYWMDWNLDAAYDHLQKALELRPAYSETHHFLGMVHCAKGDFKKAFEELDHAIQLDPLSPINHYLKSVLFALTEQFERAQETVEHCLTLDSSFLGAIEFKGVMYVMMEQYEKAIAYLDSLPKNPALEFYNCAVRGLAHAYLGNVGLAETSIARLEAKLENGGPPRAMMFLVYLYNALGQEEKTLNCIEQNINQRSGMILFARYEPLLKNLHGHPRFEDLLLRIEGNPFPEAIRTQKYKGSHLKASDANNYCQQLVEHMENQKPYLNPTLSLRKLSKQLCINPNYLSQILNDHMGKNFSEFVNGYRLEEFKQRAQDPSNSNLTLLALAYECGFNSKTVFNTYFKKQTGQTPKAYLKGLSEDII